MIPGQRGELANNNESIFHTLEWKLKCQDPLLNAKKFCNYLSHINTGPIENTLVENKWLVGLKQNEKVTIEVCTKKLTETGTQAIVCPVMDLQVHKEVEKDVGLKL